MNLDYIEITKFLNKDSISFQYLERNAIYPNATRYYFNGCNKLEVWHNENLKQINVKGSIPYFLNGHNFYSSYEDWKEGFDYLNGCLQTNLYTGIVNSFEFGTIQEIPCSENEFLHNHIKAQGMQAREFRKGNVLTGKQFENSSLRLKIYDVSRNIKHKLEKGIQEDISRLHGWNREKHYIKIEAHYKKPEAHFQGNIHLSQLLSIEFQEGLKNDLLHQYQRIMKTGKTIIPQSKADINAGTIPLIILKELEAVFGFEAEKLIKDKLKTIPEDILSPNDRKARLRTIRENLKKITLAGNSEYDISEMLKAKIQEAIFNHRIN
ncbi:MAG TPA: hypothetical protein PLG47_03275 [Candidatus Dojkabacteria bacterium]|nr:hypothetical protein [Candidatus Dojkabacteria bacterium]